MAMHGAATQNPANMRQKVRRDVGSRCGRRNDQLTSTFMGSAKYDEMQGRALTTSLLTPNETS
jgi:hypothetical protein